MRAAVYHGIRDIRIMEWPTPAPGPGEVLVRVAAAGICGSDATEYNLGPHLIAVDEHGHVDPVVLGHEFAGTVEAVGESVTGFPIGASVVCGAGISCGECLMCHRGRTNICRNYSTVGLHHDGGLAEFVVVPAGILLDVTDSGLPLDTLGLAQPMSIAVHAVRRSGPQAGQDAVVVGAGGIGAFLSFAAAATGARVLVVDFNPDRLELATKLGAFATLRAGETTIAERLAEVGMEAEAFFEVSGSQPGLESVLAAARPGAVIVPVGIQQKPTSETLGSWTLREFTIVGTVAHVFGVDMQEAVRLLGLRPDWSDFTRELIPLEALLVDGLDPLVAAASRQIKTLIDPWIDEPRFPVHTY